MTSQKDVTNVSVDAALALRGEVDPLLALAAQMHLLKELPRTGWRVRGIVAPESVAAHSHGVVVWSLWLAQRHHAQGKPALDLAKLLAIAALHDLPEAATGDLIPSQKAALFGDSKDAQRSAMEAAEARFWTRLQACESAVASEVPSTADSVVGSEADVTAFSQWRALWQEYREGKSAEARLVKQADAFDCVMQAILYRKLYQAPLDAFRRLISEAAGGDQALEQWLSALWDQ